MLIRDKIRKIIIIIFVLTSISLSGEVEVKFYGNSALSDNKINEIFSKHNIDNSINLLLDLYSNNGFPFCKITVDSAKQIGDKQIIYINIAENGLYRIEKIKNNGDLSNYFINNVCNIKGEIFSDKLIEKRLNNLKRFDFIDFNSDYSIIEENNNIIVLTKINQKKLSNITGVLTSDLDSINISGFMNINLISPQGYGRIYKLDYSRYENNLSHMGLNIEIPYVFYTYFGFNINANYDNIDSSFTKSKINLNVFYEKNDFIFQLGGGKNWNYYIFNNDSNSSYYNYNIKTKYFFTDHNIEFIYKYFFSYNAYEFFELNMNNKWKYNNIELQNKIYTHFLNSKDPLMTKEMKVSIGGTNSIKGYSENFIYVKDKIEEHISLSYYFSENIYAGIFNDIGFYSETNIRQLNDNYLLSYGPFLCLLNNKMELKIFYGINKNAGFSTGRIHLILNYVF